MRQREELYRKKLLELRAQAELRDRDRRRAVRKVPDSREPAAGARVVAGAMVILFLLGSHAHSLPCHWRTVRPKPLECVPVVRRVQAKQLSNELTALQGHLAEVQDETRYHAQAATGSAANALPQSELGDAAAAAAARDDGLDDALAGSTGGRLQLQQRRQDASPGMSMLLTAAALVVALYGFFTSDPQSVHKKVVTSLLFPLLYCGYGALQGRGFTTQALVAFCLSWFVIGFVVCNRLQVDEEP